MTTSKLTDKKVKSAKPKEVDGVLKDNYIPDGNGLYLIITAKGGKLWRYHFSFQNKKYRLPLGKYPQLSLKEARELHKEYKQFITLRAEGKSFDFIAKKLNKAKSTLI